MQIELLTKKGISSEIEFVSMDTAELQRLDNPSVFGVKLENGDYALIEVCEGQSDIIYPCTKEQAIVFVAV